MSLALPKPPRREAKPRKPLPRASKPIKRGSRPRKLRKTSIAALRRKLWELFAAYVKQRDGAVCFSCGDAITSPGNWHAGHMFPQNGPQLVRWHPKNVHSQCGFKCNLTKRGNVAAYALRFIDVYGIDEFRRLSALARVSKQWKAHELEALIAALRSSGSEFELLYEQAHILPELEKSS